MQIEEKEERLYLLPQSGIHLDVVVGRALKLKIWKTKNSQKKNKKKTPPLTL
jgi:hypothetical protein